jgi:hypothetical protein
MSVISRRAALGVLLAAAPMTALAAHRRDLAGAGSGRIAIDVSPLRRSGDNADADYFEGALPVFLRESFGPGHDVRVRIDDVVYGSPGSNGQANGTGAVDSIEGVGWVDGREIPLTCSIQATVYSPDVGGYGARLRQLMLAQSFAQWLPRQTGHY